MKAHPHANLKGSVLISAAVAASVLAIMIVGFLTYMTNEYDLNFRSHRWNQAIHLAEGATEIGLAELNYQYLRGGSGAGFQSTNGWVSGGTPGTYYKTLSTVTDGSGRTIGSLRVTVSGVGSANPPAIQGEGTVTSSNFGGTSISRAVLIRASSGTSFPVGIMAKGTIDLAGNSAYTDSFDSSNPAMSSPNGLYSDTTKQPNGNIATDATITNSVSAGNANIYGTVETGPNGTVSMGPNGSIGPNFLNPATTVASATSQGWVRNDFAVGINDVVLPAGFNSSSLGDIRGATTFNGGSFTLSSIGLNSSGDIITINGHTSLYITGNVNISGNGGIVISSGASLTVYVAGTVSIAGNAVVNDANVPQNNQWYGLPSSTSWTLNGNGTWIGTVYAPEASMSVKGGGVDGNMSGAIVANTVRLTGTERFHYDQHLSTLSGNAGYTVSTWQELKWNGSSWVQ